MAEYPSLTVLSGALSGREIEVDLSSGEAVIGSDPTCTIHVDDPGVSPRHALLQASGGEVLIQSADYASEVLLNGSAIAWLTPVSPGDEITLGRVKLRYGPPGETGGASPAADVFGSSVDESAPAFDFGSDSAETETPPALDLGGDEPEPAPPPPTEEPDEEEPAPLRLKELTDPPRVPDPETEEPPPPPFPRRSRPVPRRAPVNRAAGRPGRVQRSPVGRYALWGLAAVVVLAAAVWFTLPMFMPPRLDSVTPARVPVGQNVVLEGDYFGSSAEGVSVTFGNQAGRVVEVARTRIVAEVPALEMGAAGDLPVPVAVTVGGRPSGAHQISVFEAPQVTSLDPDVAMSGDEIRIQGSGWSDAAEVSFDGVAAEVISARPAVLRVRVPALEGTTASVRVAVGGLTSAPVPFLVGRLPLITAFEPRTASPGDVLSLRGKGFGTEPRSVLAQVGGVAALAVASTGDELRVVVPRAAAPGEAELEVRVPGSTHVGRATLQVAAESGPAGLRFVPEPFTLSGGEGRDRVVLVGDLGTRLVLAGDETQTAAARGAAVAERLAAAGGAVAAGADLELRNAESDPVIAVAGQTEPVLRVTQADADAYNESWARSSRGSGPPVTRERLGRWWGAVLADLARVVVRGQPPREAPGLAPEGAALQRLHDAAGGKPGRDLVARNASLRESLRSLALRVPASVTGSASAVAAAGPAPTAAGAGAEAPPGAFELNGIWLGATREAGRRRQISVTFSGSGGSLTYMGGVDLSQPLASLSRDGDQVRFSILRGGGQVHFAGTWDGQKLSGALSSQASGGGDVGTFELAPR